CRVSGRRALTGTLAMPRVCGITNAHSVPEWTQKDSPKKTGRAARKVNQVRLDYSLIHKSIPQRRPSSLTAPRLSMDRNAENAQDET
ncbi:hypothetical protein ABKU49_23315, partial (plasmid) [Enterobacter hormaechei]